MFAHARQRHKHFKNYNYTYMGKINYNESGDIK